MDRVTKIQFVIENVNVQAVLPLVNGAFTLRNDEDLAVLDVAQGGHQLLNLPGLPAVSGKINIGIGASHRGLQIPEFGTVHLKRQRPNDAQYQPGLPAGLADPFQFVFKFFTFCATLFAHPNGITAHEKSPSETNGTSAHYNEKDHNYQIFPHSYIINPGNPVLSN